MLDTSEDSSPPTTFNKSNEELVAELCNPDYKCVLYLARKTEGLSNEEIQMQCKFCFSH